VTYDCVVVGAGAAGITTSRALAEAGVEHLVLERGDIGNTWSTQRWDSFRLNTPGSMNAVLGDVGPAEYSTRDGTVAILAQRAERLPVRTRTTVTAARRVGDNLRLTTLEEELETRTLVVASGPKNVALIPAMAANLAPHICSLTADHYRNAAALPEGAVLVVGGGQSGGQIAEDLVGSGREVWWSTSRIGRYRARYRGRALLDWHVAAGWWATPPDALPDPAAMWTATPLIASNGRDLGIPKLGRMGVNLLGRLAEVDGTRLGFVGDVADFVAFGDKVAAELDKIADDYIAAAGFDAPPAEPDDGRGPVEAPARPTLDLDHEGITTVVWCTGFGGDYRWLPEVDTDAYGMPVLDRSGAAVGDPAIRFVGMPWQSTRASAILHGMPLDASRAVDGVTERLAG
jgi:putative flavoprotein involved in K+ transport